MNIHERMRDELQTEHKLTLQECSNAFSMIRESCLLEKKDKNNGHTLVLETEGGLFIRTQNPEQTRLMRIEKGQLVDIAILGLLEEALGPEKLKALNLQFFSQND